MIVKDMHLGGYVTADCEDSVVELSKSMRDKNLRHVYVLEGEKVVGVISLFDINNRIVAEGKSPEGLKAGDIMSGNPSVVESESEVREAYLLMLKEGKYVLPVTEKGKIIGTISVSEALKCLVKEAKDAKGAKEA